MKTAAANTIYWTLFEDEEWQFYMAATPQGLCYVGSENMPYEEMAAWLIRRFPGAAIECNDQHMKPYIDEMKEYLRGRRTQFLAPLDFHGTPFQVEVWNALRQIPYGKTCSYSEIAETIQRPGAVRAVGAAIGANPVLISVPCHRVIGKNGSLTGYRGGLQMKTRLLEVERRWSDEDRTRHA
ncbi:methylated-DNA--[protein]-cysteine S-methyltransferase [Paenibacillus sp. J22TS3]|uniref:methylated-DNA--[protein]-cysteine S-methyltransferase n=1 Tax=Paenibacillus sp. J22TS3 TaxID=2807192 RepID=UPI001B08D7C1|nr:methylated-DNA--[protein]-cysteine S-methyltransferase [Paenibacillus sp. J22TS3]GIP23841.1 methylated-DNA--protein-cysteine methyltransferase, inducible [Paenibacillus sp. J22TS3]